MPTNGIGLDVEFEAVAAREFEEEGRVVDPLRRRRVQDRARRRHRIDQRDHRVLAEDRRRDRALGEVGPGERLLVVGHERAQRIHADDLEARGAGRVAGLQLGVLDVAVDQDLGDRQAGRDADLDRQQRPEDVEGQRVEIAEDVARQIEMQPEDRGAADRGLDLDLAQRLEERHRHRGEGDLDSEPRRQEAHVSRLLPEKGSPRARRGPPSGPPVAVPD